MSPSRSHVADRFPSRSTNRSIGNAPPTDNRPGRHVRSLRWWSARPVLAATAIYVVLSIAFIGPALLPGRTLSGADFLWNSAPWVASTPPGVRTVGTNFELADASVVFQPFFEHTKRVGPDGALWNPYVMAGRPFLADAQSAVFSPFTLPVYVLSVWRALPVMAVLKLVVAALGTFLSARTLGMRFGGALVAGTVFAFGTFFVVWLAWPLTNIFPLIPWLFLLTELVVRRPEPLPVAGLAVVVALQFLGGHPETSFHVMVATILYFVFRAVLAGHTAGRQRRLLIRSTLAFVFALAAGVALAAVTLAPLVELFLHSGDYARRKMTEPGHADARFLGTLFLHDYWGRPTQTPLAAIMSNRGWYAGGLTLMLACAGLVLRPRATQVAFAGFAVLAFAVVVGIDPVFSAVTALPGFSTAHNGRMVVFVLFALAMLAGWGLDALCDPQRPRPSRRALTLGLALAILCAPAVVMLATGALHPGRLGPALKVAWGFADPPGAQAGRATGRAAVEVIHLSALLEWLVVAGAGLLLIALRVTGRRGGRTPLAAGVFASLAVAVLVVDLFRANLGFNPAIPIDHAAQPTTPAIRYLQARRPNRFAGFDRPGIDHPLQPDLAMRYGLYDARGYDYPVERRYDDFWRATAGPPGDYVPPTGRAEPTVRALRGLSLLSVADIMQDPRDAPVRLPGVRLAYSGRDARIYHNTRALPRAFVVDSQRTVRGARTALAATIDSDFDARRAAVTERRVPGVREGERGGEMSGSARIIAHADDRVVIGARARRRSLLVLTDDAYPGWQATVDGRSVGIERVDYLLRGVVLPAGTHRVEFRYAPVSWRVGWIVSLVALVGVAASALAGLRGRHRKGPS